MIREGSGAAAFFIIDTGEAAVSSKGVPINTLGLGDHFGEIALIDGGPPSATVVATTDLVCYDLTYGEFRPLVERNGSIAWHCCRRWCDACVRRSKARAGVAPKVDSGTPRPGDPDRLSHRVVRRRSAVDKKPSECDVAAFTGAITNSRLSRPAPAKNPY